MHLRHPSIFPVPPLVIALTLAAGLPACGDFDEDDLTFRDEIAPSLDEPKDPEPEPDPEPQPDPISAEKLVGMYIDDFYAQAAFVDSYVMSHRPSPSEPYNAAQEVWYEWPIHAMEWKNYASGNSLAFDLAAAEAAVAASPTYLGLSVQATDPIELDAMEAGGLVFSSDPNGTWMQANYTDPAQGLVFSALVMHFWGTPVYSAAEHFDHQQNGSVMSHSMALQELEFTLISASDVFAACGLSKATATPSSSLGVVPTCNHGAVLSADEVSLFNSIWGAPSNWVPYEANVNLPPGDVVTAWNNSYMGQQGQLVFDPPAGATGEDLAGIAVLAEALADQLLVEGDDGYLVMLRDYVSDHEG